MDCSPPGSSAHGISQAKILEWIAISFSRGSFPLRDWAQISCGSCIGRRILHHCGILYHLGNPKEIASCPSEDTEWTEVAHSCPTLCDPMDYRLPGFSVHGILRARTLEWVAISFSRGSSQPRDRTQVSCIAGRRFILWVTREDYNKYAFTNCVFPPTFSIRLSTVFKGPLVKMYIVVRKLCCFFWSERQCSHMLSKKVSKWWCI